jgi:hypothetical protein
VVGALDDLEDIDPDVAFTESGLESVSKGRRKREGRRGQREKGGRREGEGREKGEGRGRTKEGGIAVGSVT